MFKLVIYVVKSSDKKLSRNWFLVFRLIWFLLEYYSIYIYIYMYTYLEFHGHYKSPFVNLIILRKRLIARTFTFITTN